MCHNLWKAWLCLGVISKILAKTGTTVWAHGILYKVVAQPVLLYGSNILVMMGAMLKVLEVFHHRAAWMIEGMMDRHTEDGE